MTTAHRATWKPRIARGNAAVSSSIVYAHSLPSQLTLKHRDVGQGAPEEVRRRDLRAELEARERMHRKRRLGEDDDDDPVLALTGLPAEHVAPATDHGEGERQQKRRALDAPGDAPVDALFRPEEADAAAQQAHLARVAAEFADVDADDDGSDSSSDSYSDSDDDDDDRAAILAELEKIKRERAEEQERKERERLEVEALTSNPLLSETLAQPTSAAKTPGPLGGSVFSLKKSWTSDTVFRNQATDMQREREEKGKGTRMVNDTLRNPFHRKFLRKYIH